MFHWCSYSVEKTSKLSLPHGDSVDHPSYLPPCIIYCCFGWFYGSHSTCRVQIPWTQRSLAGNSRVCLFYWYQLESTLSHGFVNIWYSKLFTYTISNLFLSRYMGGCLRSEWGTRRYFMGPNCLQIFIVSYGMLNT